MKLQLVLAAVVAMTAALLPSSASPVPAPTADGDSRTTVGIRTASGGEADDRGRYDYEILPSKSKQDAVAIYNYSMKTVSVRLLARDATSTPDGEFTAQPSADTPKDVGAWIALSEQKLRLKPREMAVVPFQVGVPYNATPGDHVGSILVSLLAKEPKPGGNDVIVEHRVGLRVYLRVPGTLTPKLSVTNLKATYTGAWTSLGFGRPKATYTIRNTGNVRLSATQQVELLRSFGLSAASAQPAALKELLPGGFARVSQDFPRTWAVGDVTAKVTLSPSGLDESVKNVPDVVEETSVFVFPWLLVLALVLVLAVIGGGTVWRRRRRVRRLAAMPEPVRGKHAAAVAAMTALAALVLVGLSGVVAPPSQAAEDDHPVWKATVLPKSGGADDPIELMTSGGCPLPADSILGRVFGKGFPEEGENVIGNTKAGVTPNGPFSAPLIYSMKEFMSNQPQPVALEGTYRFVVNCRTAKYPRSHGDYVAEIRFTSPTRWVASKPVTNAIGQNLKLDEFGDPIPDPTSTPSPGTKPSEGATADPSAEPTDSAQATDGVPDLTASEEDGGGNTSLAVVLILAGAAVALSTGFVLWRRRA